MLRKLVKIANHLDQRGLRKEANHLDSIIRKMATFNSDETKERVVVKIDAEEAPDWGFDAAEKLLEALKKEAPDLDLIKLMDLNSMELSSFDEEDWEYSPEAPLPAEGWPRRGLLSSEEKHEIIDRPRYLTTWAYDMLRSFNEGSEYKWEFAREVDYEKGKSVDFALTPEEWWKIGEKVIDIRYTPGKLRIRTYEN